MCSSDLVDFLPLIGVAQSVGQQWGTDYDNPNLTFAQKALQVVQAGGESAIISLIPTGVGAVIGVIAAPAVAFAATVAAGVLIFPNVAQ